jgi:hypothetical protein
VFTASQQQFYKLEHNNLVPKDKIAGFYLGFSSGGGGANTTIAEVKGGGGRGL